MPLTRAKLTELSVLGAKLETTTGLQQTISSADGVFNVRNMKVTPTIEINKRPGQGTFSPLPGVAGKRMAKFTFQIEMHGSGSGTAPAWASTFLPAMGMYSSGSNNTFSFNSAPTAAASLTLEAYEDGVAQIGVGCVGTAKIVLETGAVPLLDCEFTGAYVGPTNAANITPTYPTVLPPVFQNAPITIGSFTPTVEKVEIDLGNRVFMRPDASTNSTTGYVAGALTAREVKGTMDPEATDLATRNWFTNLNTSVTEALSITIGNVAAHNAIVLAGPAVQCVKRERGERTGIMTDAIDLQFNRSAAGGDDEFTIQVP